MVDPERSGAWELEPGLWQLRMPLPWDTISSVNAYAIARDDGLMLVDCGGAGDPTYAESLAAAMRAAGRSIGDVRVLVGTHTHSDHVGISAWVIAQSGCRFLMHAASDHFYDAMREPERIERARRTRARREGAPAERLDDFADVREETEGMLEPVEPDAHLVDGIRLPSLLGDWEVVETPGHAPSHVCLVQRERGIAIVGDLVARSFAPYLDYGYTPDPVAELLASYDRVEAIDGIRRALPGHGRPLDDLGAVIGAHRAGIHGRLEATRAAVAAGPAGAYEVTLRMFGEPASHQTAVWLTTEVLCYLKHLREEGAVVREEDARGAYSYRPASSQRGSG
ncbi:MAG TPA: MBL fold metallo-hydrolase [Miltoncostaeaceae bacterium]|nr:MBL fold metallo-hydrolase [Miltoncostaeaceae bacterium]